MYFGSLPELAAKQVRAGMEAARRRRTFDGRSLLSALDAACRRLEGGPEEPASGLSAGEVELLVWRRYDAEAKRLGLRRGGKGAKRALPEQFGLSYSEEVVRAKLLGPIQPREFLLHTAVLFRMTPAETEEQLRRCGYQQFHARDLHDLAVWAVLNSSSAAEHPFRTVLELYQQACELVLRTPPRETAEPGAAPDADNSTRILRRSLLASGSLNADNMLEYVALHPEYYNARHRRLLLEHGRLANLFVLLYDRESAAAGHREWQEEESAYSFYRFVHDFCKPLEHVRFADNLYGQTAKKNRNPTRELMILLWLHTWCFRFLPAVAVPPQLRRLAPIRAGVGTMPFTSFISMGCDCQTRLNVNAYLELEPEPLQEGGAFSGTELRDWLNWKLENYGWGPLSDCFAFDRCLKALLDGLCLGKDGSVRFGELRAKPGALKYPENVPFPLAWFRAVLECLEKELGYKPLDCDLYVQRI